MSIDPKISQAIKDAVEEAGQSPTLTRRITAWLEAVTSGNEDPADQTAAARHIEMLYAEVSVTTLDQEEL